MNSEFNIFMLVAGVGVLVAVIFIILAFRWSGRLVKAAMFILALVFIIPAAFLLLLFQPELVDGRFRTYKQFYKDIQVGMTRAEVLAALDERYPTNGPRQRPK